MMFGEISLLSADEFPTESVVCSLQLSRKEQFDLDHPEMARRVALFSCTQ